jgi:hypothetical protein
MSQEATRLRHLRIALFSLVTAMLFLLSPRLVQRIYAQDLPSCSANCARGSCSGNGNCTCSCSFWTGAPICSCSTGATGGEEHEVVTPP